MIACSPYPRRCCARIARCAVSVMFARLPPRRAAPGLAQCGSMRICEGLCCAGRRGENVRHRRQPAERRAKPRRGGADPRGAGAPADLAPAPRRPGQDQHLDLGEGAVRPAVVHARDHHPAGGGARHPAAHDAARSAAAGAAAARARARRARLLLAARRLVDRGQLPDAAALVQRRQRNLRVPDGDLLARLHPRA